MGECGRQGPFLPAPLFCLLSPDLGKRKGSLIEKPSIFG